MNSHPFLSNPPSTTRSRSLTAPLYPAFDARSIPPTIVTNLDIDVTEACNLACTYCFKGDLNGQHMDASMLRQCYFWLEAASRGARDININFMGGEPTMRWKQIRDFVPWARQRGALRGKKVTFSMTSNLTLWTEEIRAFVDQYGFGVLMSIDGCPEVQDAQRPSKTGRPMSAVVELWARSMLRTRPRSTARMTVSPKYVHRLEDSINYLFGIGFREVTIGTAAYDAWGEAEFAIFEQQLTAVVEVLVAGYLAGNPLNITTFKYLINNTIQHRQVGLVDRVVWHKSPCGAGKGYLMIDHTGDIWPCHRFDGADADIGAEGAFRLGNIFKPGFHLGLQRAFVEFDHSRFRKPSCDTCPCDPTCAGYCPAANVASSGSIHTPPDAYCRLSQALYRAAELLWKTCDAHGLRDALVADCGGAISDGR